MVVPSEVFCQQRTLLCRSNAEMSALVQVADVRFAGRPPGCPFHYGRSSHRGHVMPPGGRGLAFESDAGKEAGTEGPGANPSVPITVRKFRMALHAGVKRVPGCCSTAVGNAGQGGRRSVAGGERMISNERPVREIRRLGSMSGERKRGRSGVPRYRWDGAGRQNPCPLHLSTGAPLLDSTSSWRSRRIPGVGWMAPRRCPRSSLGNT